MIHSSDLFYHPKRLEKLRVYKRVMYNYCMNLRIDKNTRLQEACFLTEVRWAAFVYHEMDAWQVKNTCRFPKSQIVLLKRFLQGEIFRKWIGGTPLTKRHKSLVLPDQVEIGCSRLYLFPVTSMKFMLVGVDDKLDSKSQRIWKLAANLNETDFLLSADSEVVLLKNRILEYQLNQQELQARINAQSEAEAGLIQTAKLAAVGEMAAGVAHELNNPLTSIVGFTELALDELAVDSPVRSDLELVLQEARRARGVVRSLLDFARQSETIRVKADINEIVNDVLVLTRHYMLTNNIRLDTHLDENLAWVFVDRNQIKQVVINLVNNALYAMPSGGQLLIETKEQTRLGRPWITLSIVDSGVGIPAENLNRIFEPFFTTRGDQGGTGLGLSVTFGIVTDHGGMIEVESELQVGSSFMVSLPLDQTE